MRIAASIPSSSRLTMRSSVLRLRVHAAPQSAGSTPRRVSGADEDTPRPRPPGATPTPEVATGTTEVHHFWRMISVWVVLSLASCVGYNPSEFGG